MKNIFRFLMAVAILFTASCAKEDISSSIGGGEVEMTFTVDLPELGTRAYADGAKATTLRYYVYEGDNYLRGISSETLGTTTLTNGKAVVTLPLLKGMTYNIIFWADNGSDIYSIDPATKVLTVDYTGVMSNDDSRDAFYKYLTNVDPTDAVKIKEQAKVTLTRPFGQLNAATSDFEAVENNGVTLTTSALTAIKANTTLNLATGIADTQEEITFAEAAIPTEALPNKTGYKYLSMNYLLPGTVDAVYTFKGERSDNSEVEFTGTTYTNVPVKANYRTNILGKLLTASTDFTVEIEAEFNEPAEDYQVVTVNVPSNNTEDIVISVGTIQVTVPAAAAQAGDKYKVVASNENTATDSATGATTVAFDLTLYKNDVKVSGGDVVYAVTKNIGADLFISEVTHNGTAMTNATTGADQTYTYDDATGVLTIYTKTFSPFAVTYANYKDYERKLNIAHNKYSTISVSTGGDLLPIVAVNPEIYGYSVYDGDTRITDKVIFRFSDVKKETISENSYKVSFILAVKDANGNDLTIKEGRMNQYIQTDPREYLHVYVNLLEVPAGYSVSEVKVDNSSLVKTTRTDWVNTGEYMLLSNGISFQSKTAGLIEITVTKVN